ncbi:MAG TPA: glycosyltransferase family 2 protein [Thermoanaerobaculia bacterium]|nr:glycosyltransferase family 2 protein [Thermoanaerobaculia bacterium]
MVDTDSVSAVIVHFRTPDETVRAARAVAETFRCPIVVVDNASGDGIADRLAAEAPRARVVAEPENRGYGAACNRGAAETAGAYLLFLNSDAFVAPGAVEALAGALDADPRAAAVGPRLVNPDGSLQPSICRLPTPWRIFCESSGLAALSGGRGFLRGHTKTREDHGRAQAVTALTGAALLVRRSAFEGVGGFDESFFLYAEETDLITRLQRRGYRILYEPRAAVMHVGGASGGDVLFGELHGALCQYVEKFHGRTAARFASVVLALGAAARYAAALVTPGDAGRRRRTRYRAALARRTRSVRP